MFTASFHSLGGNGPNLRGKVDLGPLRAKDFARTRCRQNGKPQSHGSDSLSFSKLVDEGWNDDVGHRRVMTARELGLLGRRFSRRPRQAAEFSPELKLLALAALRTRSIRPLRRDAVSGLSVHKGLRTARIVVITSTDKDRNGAGYFLSVIAH